MSTNTSCPAPAKLNLMLRVTGRRADGYHLLQTVFRFIDYGDTLRFTVRADGAITRANELAGGAARGGFVAAGGRPGAWCRYCARKAPAVRRRARWRQLGRGDHPDRVKPLVGSRFAARPAAGTGARAWRRRAGVRVRRVGAGRGRRRATTAARAAAGLVSGAYSGRQRVYRQNFPRPGFEKGFDSD